MKKNYSILFIAVVISLPIACSKTTSPEQEISPNQVAIAPVPILRNYQCTNSPNYGDSILYAQPTKNDYIVKPVNQAALGKGKYLSWPVGLMVDSATGAIDVSQSETGMRYLIGFVKEGTKDTCIQNLILAGITYVDSIYVLNKNDTLAAPYYNANAAVGPVCNPGNINGDEDKQDGDDKCAFDGKDKKNKKGQARNMKVFVNTINGAINLKRSLAEGVFGVNPVNGAQVIAPIYYSLYDKSNKAIQVINVDLRFYNKKSDVPVSLLNEIQYNQASFYGNQPIMSRAPRPPVIVVTNFE